MRYFFAVWNKIDKTTKSLLLKGATPQYSTTTYNYRHHTLTKAHPVGCSPSYRSTGTLYALQRNVPASLCERGTNKMGTCVVQRLPRQERGGSTFNREGRVHSCTPSPQSVRVGEIRNTFCTTCLAPLPLSSIEASIAAVDQIRNVGVLASSYSQTNSGGEGGASVTARRKSFPIVCTHAKKYCS